MSTPAAVPHAGDTMDDASAGVGLLPLALMIVDFIATNAMIFGGIVPFVPQYLQIRRSGRVGGFSTFVCLALLIANILRIYFWFGKWYELPLLAQSVIMVVTMLTLQQECVRTKRVEVIGTTRRTRLRFWPLSVFWRDFWAWVEFSDYVLFLSVFCFVVGALSYLLLDVWLYYEVLGFASLLTEALLGLPQWLRNNRNKSTEGMSLAMVCCWLSGDIFKTGYFLAKSAPLQFWLCGLLQISLDLSILSQVFMYRGNTAGFVHPK
eukprot:m.488201 g.488201  ORF g.488201 m.488201 type:complete len:264 (-) comp25629_c0_seq1:41-832(-)